MEQRIDRPGPTFFIELQDTRGKKEKPYVNSSEKPNKAAQWEGVSTAGEKKEG